MNVKDFILLTVNMSKKIIIHNKNEYYRFQIEDYPMLNS